MSEEPVERDSQGVSGGVKVGQRTWTEAKAAAPPALRSSSRILHMALVSSQR